MTVKNHHSHLAAGMNASGPKCTTRPKVYICAFSTLIPLCAHNRGQKKCCFKECEKKPKGAPRWNERCNIKHSTYASLLPKALRTRIWTISNKTLHDCCVSQLKSYRWFNTKEIMPLVEIKGKLRTLLYKQWKFECTAFHSNLRINGTGCIYSDFSTKTLWGLWTVCSNNKIK